MDSIREFISSAGKKLTGGLPYDLKIVNVVSAILIIIAGVYFEALTFRDSGIACIHSSDYVVDGRPVDLCWNNFYIKVKFEMG